ncbi:hypothetical protein BDP27DRAFT_1310372 [Rhodocollybia butyracea]|uniref:Uncharacterized protein n=1 Tax=Rhodocollybia butyracea TaxID=206335 RepID=A0A9P5UF36_9AGAR|nr:hypothetical protein BDP27DRAFT_1310372 [Rhodocollybia butyracea]
MPSSSYHFHMKSSRHSTELANADISRLMDPSYHSHTYGTEAYVDTRGEMHDPDFQFFPVYSGKSRRGRRSSDPARALWVEDEEEEEEEEQTRSRAQYHTRRPRTPISSSSSAPSSLSSSPLTQSTSLPSPYTSVYEEKPHHSILPKRFRRHSSSSFDDDFYSEPFEYDDEDEQTSISEVHSIHAPAPHLDLSYSQAMRKQWLALSLTLRVGLFRAKRRASNCRSKTT